MQDLFYMLLGVAVIVLPIYLIIKAIKNKSGKENRNNDLVDVAKKEKVEIKKEMPIVKEKKVKY